MSKIKKTVCISHIAPEVRSKVVAKFKENLDSEASFTAILRTLSSRFGVSVAAVRTILSEEGYGPDEKNAAGGLVSRREGAAIPGRHWKENGGYFPVSKKYAKYLRGDA